MQVGWGGVPRNYVKGGVHEINVGSVPVPVPSLWLLHKMPRECQEQSPLTSGPQIPKTCPKKAVVLTGADIPPSNISQVAK